MLAHQATSATASKSPQHWGDVGGPHPAATQFAPAATAIKSPMHGGFRGPLSSPAPSRGEEEEELKRKNEPTFAGQTAPPHPLAPLPLRSFTPPCGNLHPIPAVLYRDDTARTPSSKEHHDATPSHRPRHG
jgi:hypothetical protein